MTTTTATLTDRYVDAAMRTIPEAQRADLAAELRGSIDDQIDARLERGEAPDAAEHAVLTDLGDPDKLAAQYLDRPLWLVGPRYYLTWWRLLKVLWAIVPACAAFGVALGQSLAGENLGTIVGTVASVTVGVIVHVAFWTTMVFVVVERSERGVDSGFVTPWTPEDLPELQQRRASLGELIASLSLLACAAGLTLWDHFVGVVYLAGTGWVSFLASDLWPGWIGGLLALLVLEALLAIWVYAKGGWRFFSATVSAALNVAIAGGTVWLLANERLIDPRFFATVIPTESAGTVAWVVTTILGFSVVAVAVWDGVDGYLKARRP